MADVLKVVVPKFYRTVNVEGESKFKFSNDLKKDFQLQKQLQNQYDIAFNEKVTLFNFIIVIEASYQLGLDLDASVNI